MQQYQVKAPLWKGKIYTILYIKHFLKMYMYVSVCVRICAYEYT